MDPISAAGIGLSVISLALQVFAGCVKGNAVASSTSSCINSTKLIVVWRLSAFFRRRGHARSLSASSRSLAHRANPPIELGRKGWLDRGEAQ